MTTTHRYWAFLSYSHADEAQARRLHILLERYVLPARVRKAHGLPRRLFPIFRDVEELEAASGLTTRLQDALNESRWLIVLCSSNSAKSKYVNEEIEYFLGKHGPSRILCVLLAGEPPDCYPPAIKSLKDEPLAADCRSGRDSEIAKLKLIAALAGVGFTELRDREAQRKRRTRLMLAAAAALISAGALAYWDLFIREQVDYYVGYVRKNGIWQGVNRVSNDSASHRAATYRFTRRGRLHPPQRVDYVNGGGDCVYNEHEDYKLTDLLGESPLINLFGTPNPPLAYCSAHFSYVANGSIHEETLNNALGAAKFSLIYTTANLAQLSHGGYAMAAQGGGIRYVEFKRDAQGYDRELYFSYGEGQPRRNQFYAYGYTYNYDTQGRVIRSDALDSARQPMGLVERYAYSGAGELLSNRHEDAQGRLREANSGEYELRWERDRYGNPTRRSNYSAAGVAVSNTQGYASQVMDYNPLGHPVEYCFFDPAGQAVTSNGYHCDRYQRNAQGSALKEESFDKDGTLVGEGDSAITEYFCDKRGNIIELRQYDHHHQPIDIYGAIQRMEFDAQGNQLALRFLDSAGRPELTSFGAGILLKYDARGNEIEQRSIGLDDRPVISSTWGYAVRRAELDERGNTIALSFYDGDLHPMLSLEGNRDGAYGYAAVRYRLDEAGNIVETRFLGTRGQLIRNSNGVALVRNHYNALGNNVEEVYFDSHERPVAVEDGSYGYRASHNARGQLTEKTFVDATGAASAAALGYAVVRYEGYTQSFWDPQQTAFTRASYLDAKGRLIGRVTRRNSRGGSPTELRYFDAQNRPAPAPQTGCTVELRQYDPGFEMDLSDEVCLDATGKTVARKDTGWARRHLTLEHGRPIKEEYFDAAGKPVKPRK